MASRPLSMSTEDWRKIGTGLVLALIGAVLTWCSEFYIPLLEKSPDETKLLLAAFLAVLVNALRKFIFDTRTAEKGD